MEFAFSYVHIFILHVIAAWPLLGLMTVLIVLLVMSIYQKTTTLRTDSEHIFLRLLFPQTKMVISQTLLRSTILLII